jgi:hypothetical protein
MEMSGQFYSLFAFPLDRLVGGFQSQFRRCGIKNNLLGLPGIELQPPSSWTITVHTELIFINYTEILIVIIIIITGGRALF